MRACLFLAFVAACSDFSSIEPGVCGNGIIEAGEDCDADDARCVRCAVVCSTNAECPTADYTCGVDGFCHAPGGVLGQPSAPVPFQIDDFRVTDIDRDGAGDVVGVSKTSIVVRFGGGKLASFVTPAQSGPAAFGDLDGDGTLDLTLSTADGLVSFTSRFGTLSPVDVESPLVGDTGQTLDIVTSFPIGPQQIGAFIDDGQGRVFLVAVDLTRSATGTFVEAPCAARIGALSKARFSVDRLDVYQATPRGQLPVDMVVAFTTDTGQLCATSIHGTRPALPLLNQFVDFAFADVTPAGAGPVHGKPVFADLDTDSDPCPMLINPDGGPGGLRAWDGSLSGGHCTLAAAGASGAALPAIAGVPATAVPVGRIPVSPTILTLASDALVLSSGVYVFSPGQNAFGSIYDSGRRIAHVATADLDNDGDIDAVLAVAGEDDLDVLFRAPLGLELIRVDTQSEVTTVTIADYDGNGIPDIAYTETANDHQNMLVAYGTPDRPLPPVQVATFSGIRSVVPIQFPDSVDRLAIADDLFVIQPPAPNKLPTATLLHGSPQRTMLSFFDPRADGLRGTTLPRGGVVGNFVDSTPEHPDLLVFATSDMPTPLAFVVAGGEGGLDPQPNNGVLASGLADCPSSLGGTGVCVADAQYLTYPNGMHDLVFAVDRASPPHAARLDASGTGLASMPMSILVQSLPAGVSVRSLHAVDVDGDGAAEIVASFGTSDATEGSVRACTVANGVPTACQELSTLAVGVVPGLVACTDAAPGRVGPKDPFSAPSAARDLVMLCHTAGNATTPAQSSLYRVFHDGTQLALDPQPLGIASNLRSLRVADVTGDGVDDVVAVQGDTSRSLIIFAQCDARDAGACRRSSAAPAGGGP